MTDANDGTYSAIYTASAVGTINVSVYLISGINGLSANYYTNANFLGTPIVQVEDYIDYNW